MRSTVWRRDDSVKSMMVVDDVTRDLCRRDFLFTFPYPSKVSNTVIYHNLKILVGRQRGGPVKILVGRQR